MATHEKDAASAAKKAKGIKTSKVESGRLKLLVVVVNQRKGDYFADLIQSYDVNMQLSFRANGTASAQMISLLGLEDSSRAVIFGVIREDRAAEILSVLEEKFRTVKGGKGIAYTVPLSSVIGVLTYGFLSNDLRTVKEEKK